MSRNLATDPPARAPVVVAENLEPALTPAAKPRKVSFVVQQGSVVCLTGPAGSGKSQLIDLLSFEGAPRRGRLEIFGVDPTRVSPRERPAMRRRVGIVFQDQRLLGHLGTFANVALAARAAGRRPRDYADEVSQLLAWVGLEGRGGDRLAKLTEGDRRRLCLARALINRPELLLLDEPTAGLGDAASRSFLRLVKAIGSAGASIVLATRDDRIAEGLGAAVCELGSMEGSA